MEEVQVSHGTHEAVEENGSAASQVGNGWGSGLNVQVGSGWGSGLNVQVGSGSNVQVWSG